MTDKLPEHIDQLGSFYKNEAEGRTETPSSEFFKRIEASVNQRHSKEGRHIKLPFLSRKIAASVVIGSLSLLAAIAATVTITVILDEPQEVPQPESNPSHESVPLPIDEIEEILPMPDTIIESETRDATVPRVSPEAKPSDHFDRITPPQKASIQTPPSKQESPQGVDDFLDDMFIEKDSGWFDPKK